MRVLGWLVVAAVALALLRAALVVLVAGVIVLLIIGLLCDPAAVCGFIILCVLAGLVQQHPLPCLGVAALVIVAGICRPR